MATQVDNKKLVRRIPLEVVNEGKFELIDEILASGYVEHSAPPQVPATREGMRQWFSAMRSAFPDLHYTIDDIVAEGDQVVLRTTGHGTMRGALMGFQPTGKAATWTEIHITRVQGGKVVEHWGQVDQVGMLQQLGLLPAQAPASSSSARKM